MAIALAALFASRNYEALRSSVKSGYQKAVEDIRALNQISQMKEPDSGKIVTSIPTPLIIGSQERTASHVVWFCLGLVQPPATNSDFYTGSRGSHHQR